MALVAGAALSASARSPSAGATVVRVNQVGYGVSAPKLAFALTRRATGHVRFAVVRSGGAQVALASRSRRSCGRWNGRWQGCQVIDFSALRRPGTYRIRVDATMSPPFRIASDARLYGPLAARAVEFLQAQRDGPDVIAGSLHRDPAHLSDAGAAVYAIPPYRAGRLAAPLQPTGASVDLAGGWFDAGDYLKYSGTASFTDALLLFTLREYGAELPAAGALAREARFGTDWLLQTWDPQRKVLYEQVGIGDGNGGSVLGDHDVWRLPQRDDRYRARPLRFVARRPVFAANSPGAPVSPNLAGREAAAFALCAQVWAATDPGYAHRCLLAGQTLYDAAAPSWRGPLAGSVPASYYAADESVWQDDMELAATELYLATFRVGAPDLPHPSPDYYLKPASWWANQYESSPRADVDSFNLYDVSGLADYDLYRVMVDTGHTTDLWTNASDVLGDLRDQLRLGARLARTGPLGLADPATPVDTVAHALGYAAEARLYAALGVRGGGDFARLAQQQLNWVLGANPWGSSFVVGAGSRFPDCLAHQLANLSGSLTGSPPILAGAVVAGPTGASHLDPLGAPDGYRHCSAGAAGFAAFDAHGYVYLDDVRSPSTSEPGDDLAALSLLAFAQEIGGSRRAATEGLRAAVDTRPARARSLRGVTISEYWPVPESWFRGALVSTPGIPGRHRVDWLYSGTGLVMEADGITLTGQRVHVDDFGRERWVNARGHETRPTPSGIWTHGDPAWRVGGWRNARGAVTFPLEAGGWSNGIGVHYAPVPGVRFAVGPSLPLIPYHSVAVDPRVIPAGSRIYIPAYRHVNGGWFVAQDTGSGIIGRHIDVYRLPPANANGGRFLEHQRVLVVPPAPRPRATG